MNDHLTELLGAQLRLQIESMKDGDPRLLADDARALFITWNAYALEDEIHEATGEVGWKPWAKSRHVNGEAMMKELIDALHFWMNLVIVAGAEMGIWDTGELATRVFDAYMAKNHVNADRQREGYDGVSSKCPGCKREMSETDTSLHRVLRDGRTVCSPRCVASISSAW